MPKPFGEGLEYFQVDVDIHDHWKMELLRDRFKDAGVSFWLFTHCRLFRNSYYVELTDHFVEKFCSDILEKSVPEFMHMLEFAIDHKIFYKPYYEEFGILTSRGIQARYLEISKRWAKVRMIHDYIVPKVNVFNYELCFYNIDGDYIGYKRKNQREIINEIYVPRKHVAKDKKQADPEPDIIPDKPEKPYLGAIITNQHHYDEDLTKEVLGLFALNEVNNIPQRNLFIHFTTTLIENNQLTWFKSQFDAFKQYCGLTNKEFLGRFDTFIGEQSQKFENGRWLSTNWEEQLKIEKTKHTKNGRTTGTRAGHAQEGFGKM
jgi:hypothetical protein